MKMRRRTGVNGVRENHRDTVVNQGGTAESFGPLSGRKARLLRKIQGRILPRRNKNREERRGEHYGKRKKLVESITAREVDFAQWYTDVVREAKLCDYSGVKDV